MSLRARLLIGTLVIAVVLAVSGIAVLRTTRANLVAQVDARLALATSQLGRAPARPGGPLDTDAVRLSDLYAGFVNERGVLVTRLAPDLADGTAPTPILSDTPVAELQAGRTITVPSDDDAVDYRMAGRADRAGVGLGVVGIPLEGVDEATRRLFVVQGFALSAALAVLGLVTWWVVRLGVRPVRRMTETAGAIAAGDLSARVPEGTPGTEAGDLGVALNGMLGRIEEAFDQRTASEDRLRRFVADASHELRTPVATIRGYAELHRTGALADPAALDDAMRRTEQEAVRMGGLVDDLLHLARLDQGRP
ncbi:MAG: histidine kinase dimerization/phospho-acceptor domain-containing protein, partial [Acidimicrobiales bacterium]|nr:histidine kinase dimerization/phospho-acceptor domain-containing protein [Acidimicrobiales bacterium]